MNTFSTHQGRLSLSLLWAATTNVSLHTSGAGLAEWLCWCISEGHLDPHARLPPYEQLAALPFGVTKKDVAQVIRQLRTEHVLPARKRRKDALRPQWTARDLFCLDYIGHMHALRFDQLQRLLARTSPSSEATTSLSHTRTWEIVQRWVDAKLALSRSVYSSQPYWVFLTRKGLYLLGLPFRAAAPSVRSLEHLYWITEVRMQLEEEYPIMQWVSERSLQVGKEMRVAGQRRKHLPDGILILPSEDGIDIEVQISKPIPHEVKKVLCEELWSSESALPLRYYVNPKSSGVVRAMYTKMRKESEPMRSSIEIFDLFWREMSFGVV